MVSKLPSSSLVSTSATSSRRPAAGSSNTGVCRTLFHHREIGARFPSRSASSTAVTLQKSLQESSEDDGSEVVVKDCNGNFDFQTPCLPPHEDDQLQDEFTERESTQEDIMEFKSLAYAVYRDWDKTTRDVQEQEFTAWWAARRWVTSQLPRPLHAEMEQNYSARFNQAWSEQSHH